MRRHLVSTLGSLVVILMALVLAVPVSARDEGSTLLVGNCPECEYTSIQDAVDDAEPGDKILVFPGFYFQTVTIRKNDLEILAQGSGVEVAADTGIACFDVEADHVVIRGFDMTGPMLASGIQFEGSHNTFEDNVIHDLYGLGVNALTCRDPDGGSNFNRILNNTISQAAVGIVIQAGRDDFPEAVNRGNIIQGNTIFEVTVAPIAVENGIDFLVSQNTITGPGDMEGHCLLVGGGYSSTVTQGHHRVVGNHLVHCARNGIDVYTYNSNLEGIQIWGNEIVDVAQNGIGVDTPNGLITANEIRGNKISSAACGIGLESAPGVVVSDNLIKANHVFQNRIGGICLGPGATRNRVEGNDASDNRLDNIAHGILVEGDDNRIEGNTARRNDGSGILVFGDDNEIIRNTALENGVTDLSDWGADNRWRDNTYETSNGVADPPGTIIVTKETKPDGDRTVFHFEGDAAGAIADGQSIVVTALEAGTYTSRELVPEGWVLTSIDCDDADSSGEVETATATFRLQEDEKVTCTFTDARVYTLYLPIVYK